MFLKGIGYALPESEKSIKSQSKVNVVKCITWHIMMVFNWMDVQQILEYPSGKKDFVHRDKDNKYVIP